MFSLRGDGGSRRWAALIVAVLVATGCADDTPDATESEETTTTTATSSTTTSTTTTSTTTTSTTTTTPVDVTEPPPVAAVAVTGEAIASATLTIDGVVVDLVDGLADEPLDVRVVGSVIGDLTGDGVDDGVAVVVHQQPGTTGSWSSLVAFHHPGDELAHATPMTYADRGRTHDLRMVGSDIVVRWSEQQFFDGVQTTDSYRLGVDPLELEMVESTTDPLIVGIEGGLRMDGDGTLDFGASPDDVLGALSPVFGEPSRSDSDPTCWGEAEFLGWAFDTVGVGFLFLGGEWYQWSATDSRFATENIVVPGAGLGWLEQWEGMPFETYTSELSGQLQALIYGGRASFDPVTGDVIEVGGDWASDFARLHTVIDDDIDLWCGD